LAPWDLWPLLGAIVWFGLCSWVITPAFNSGNIDYVTLYDRLGKSGSDILRNAFTQPQLIGHALFDSLTHGNLLWALLFPFLGLPLLRPRWLVISTPILMQHLLSWRSSEWTIYFHYAAPLLPLFWMATAETIVGTRKPEQSREKMEGGAPATPPPDGLAGARPSIFRHDVLLPLKWLPPAVLVACAIANACLGPAGAVGREIANWPNHRADRERKNAFLQQIPANASVVAGLPYLSHLAMREKLYSLHYILKGLKTLSHATYEPPPPTDYVFIDYKDSATFDAGAGYYHPQMKTKDGRVIPSSDELLKEFLQQASGWQVTADDELVLFHKR
jgi:hypothetical protein